MLYFLFCCPKGLILLVATSGKSAYAATAGLFYVDYKCSWLNQVAYLCKNANCISLKRAAAPITQPAIKKNLFTDATTRNKQII